jgi:hypothetical protein
LDGSDFYSTSRGDLDTPLYNKKQKSKKKIFGLRKGGGVPLTKFSKRNQSLLSLDNTTNASSTKTKFNSLISRNSLSATITSKSFNLSIDEYKTYIIDNLNSWCESNKSKFNLSNFSLIKGQHYFISILNHGNGILRDNIKCCCEK